ncbi:MAG TPA: GNAT family N-acetyltransferase [Rhizomicrobium sp.]|jgi:ribosomal protein S18 acetylase RimI-like enzyme|nr:GNAT family N-acetyltransferase [Rhizomicrobium sp.]
MLWPTSSSDDFTIAPARTAIELTSAAALFRAYARSLPVDLSPQGFSRELQSLPGVYAAPAGELLLAKRGDHVLGAVALKALAPPDVAEIKRLFVRPQARKTGVGKALVAAILKTAAERGYREIKLDTLPAMQSAIALYTSFGFAPIAPYGSHPYPGLVTLGLTLPEK